MEGSPDQKRRKLLFPRIKQGSNLQRKNRRKQSSGFRNWSQVMSSDMIADIWKESLEETLKNLVRQDLVKKIRAPIKKRQIIDYSWFQNINSDIFVDESDLSKKKHRRRKGLYLFKDRNQAQEQKPVKIKQLADKDRITQKFIKRCKQQSKQFAFPPLVHQLDNQRSLNRSLKVENQQFSSKKFQKINESSDITAPIPEFLLRFVRQQSSVNRLKQMASSRQLTNNSFNLIGLL